jgi:DNA-binding transcriptional MerR regulator
MTSLRTAIPYTPAYVQQLLEVDEQVLVSYVHALGITPQQDDITGSLIFTQADVDALRRTIHAEQTGLANPVNRMMPTSKVDPGMLDNQPGQDAALLTRQVNAPAPEAGQLGVVVDAVNQVKAGILKDLSQLLDDKLSGLDEVVIELIRAKSDNDSLKQRLSLMQDEVEHLKFELGRFKPVQFGFYRKG